MPDPRFPILGAAIAPMIGRATLMARVWRALTKPSPSHLTIVGPRYAGKSVFFKSNELEHEVLVTYLPRMSITGWLKTGNQSY